MVNLHVNFNSNSVTNTELLKVNKHICQKLRRLDVAQNVFSWIDNKAKKIGCATTVISLVVPAFIIPSIALLSAYVISTLAFRFLARYEKNIIVQKNQIYKNVSFLNLSKLNLGCENFPDISTLRNAGIKNSGKFKNTPSEIHKLINTYASKYEKAQKTIERDRIKLKKEILTKKIKQLDIKKENNISSLEGIIANWLNEEINKLNNQLQTEGLTLHNEFLHAYTFTPYQKYEAATTNKNEFLTHKQYAEKIQDLIIRLKKVKMIITLQELFLKPLQVEADVNWMEKKLKFKHFK